MNGGSAPSLSVAPAAQSFGPAGRSRASNPGDRLAVALPILVFLASLPLASNRPVFWMANALVVGLFGLALAIAGPPSGGGRGRGPSLKAAGLLFGAAVLWMALQTAVGFLHGAGLPVPEGTLSPANGYAMTVRHLTAGAVLVLASEIHRRSRSAETGLATLFVLTVVQGVIALISLVQLDDTILLLPKWAYPGFATGTFVNRNHLATFLGAGAAVGAALLARDVDRALSAGRRGVLARLAAGHALALLAGLAILVAAVLATGSRMGLAVTAAGVLVASTLVLARHDRRRLLIVLGAGMVIGLVSAVSVVRDGMLERLGALDEDTDVRLELYDQTIDLILEAPLSGHGAGSYETAFLRIRRPPISPDRTWSEAHNSYLELAAEIGIPATVALFGALGLVLLVPARALRDAEDPAPAAAAIAVGTLFALHALVDFSAQIQANTLLLALVLGIGVARARPLRVTPVPTEPFAPPPMAIARPEPATRPTA